MRSPGILATDYTDRTDCQKYLRIICAIRLICGKNPGRLITSDVTPDYSIIDWQAQGQGDFLAVAAFVMGDNLEDTSVGLALDPRRC